MSKKTRLSVVKISIPGTQSDELCYVFSERLDEHNSNSDTVFGIFQIRSSSEAYHSIIEKIVKHILDFYYRAQENNSQTKTGSGVGAAEFLFENALQYANDHVINMIEEMQDSLTGRTVIDRNRISLLIGVISGEDLFLTSTGNAVKAYMLYPVSRNGTFSHYSAISIADEQSQDRSIDVKKLFTNVIAGTFSIPGSTLVVCNARFNDYIPIDQIKQIVTSYPFDHVSKYLYNLLGKANEHTDFNALFLSLQEADATDKKGTHLQTRSDDSINELVEQQKNTQSILSPAVVNHIKTQIASFMDNNIIKPSKSLRISLKNVDYQKHAKTIKGWSRHVSVKTKRSISVVKKNYKNPLPAVKKISLPTQFSPNKAKTFVVSKTKDVSVFYNKLREQGPRYALDWFSGLSMLSKGLLALAVIFIFLFASSIVTLNKKNNQESQDQAYAAQVSAVEQKINQAESSMIFEDEAKAVTLLAEAQIAIEALPRNSADRITTSDSLKERIAQANQKMRKVYPVNATEVANLSNQIPTLTNLSMTVSLNEVLVYNNDSIYALERADGKVTQINTQAKIPSIGCAGSLSDELFYFCSKEGDRLYEVNLKNKETKQITTKLGSKEVLQHITFFNNRLYALDPTSNTIYRHSKTKDGFGTPIQWYTGTSTASVTDGRQITIDGTALVLKQAANLMRISSNKASQLSFEKVEPAIESIQQFWAAEESNFLYLLDPAGKRILILNKANNKLVAQLTSDILADARSFAIFEKKKEILVLTSSSIVSLPITTLK